MRWGFKNQELQNSQESSSQVEMMRNRGNAWCQAVWLGLFDAQSQPVDYKDDEKIKEFIIAKYEKKRSPFYISFSVRLVFISNYFRYYVDPSQARISRVSSASPAPEQLSTARLDFKGLELLKQSLSFLLSLFVCIIFQTCTSSRSSLASGSLIGSTLKARMEPSSQVLYSCLCSGTGFVAT